MKSSMICGAVLQSLLYVFCNAQNWMIDPASCDVASGKFALVQTAMTNALLMANAANAAITQTPRNLTVQTGLDFLFNNGDASLVTDYGPRVFGATGITRLTTQVTTTAQLGVNDVKIYCDQSRLERTILSAAPPQMFDTDIDQILREDDYEKCNIFFTTAPTFMYTVLPRTQICPTSLTWALPVQNKWTAALSASFWKKMGVAAARQLSRLFYAQIDAYSLFDKVLLHELTHANCQYTTYDAVVGGSKSYGWNKCRDISIVRSNPAGGGLYANPQGPEINADSWALFGSFAYQLAWGTITGINSDDSPNIA